MSKNTSVTLGEHFEKIIEKSIESGRYSSASEVIREGLRLVDEREQKIRIFKDFAFLSSFLIQRNKLPELSPELKGRLGFGF